MICIYSKWGRVPTAMQTQRGNYNQLYRLFSPVCSLNHIQFYAFKEIISDFGKYTYLIFYKEYTQQLFSLVQHTELTDRRQQNPSITTSKDHKFFPFFFLIHRTKTCKNDNLWLTMSCGDCVLARCSDFLRFCCFWTELGQLISPIMLSRSEQSEDFRL